MHCEVWRPHSVLDGSLSEVPLLEEVALILLMSRMDSSRVLHLVREFFLFKTLVNQQIVFLVHGSVTSLASSLPYFETTSQSC